MDSGSISADEVAGVVIDYVQLMNDPPEPVKPQIQPSTYALTILMALNRKVGSHMYLGTVAAGEIAKRRAKGKRAKQARKINRLTNYR